MFKKIILRNSLDISVVDVKTAIPMIMGANIGTSMTSTLVSLTHMGDKDQVNVSTITNYCIFIQLYIVLLISISRFSHFYLSVRKGLFCCSCP